MPRLPQYKSSSMRELFRQLAFTPQETLERIMDAAAELVSEIDPDRAYPEDFIVYRVTGYRPESTDEPSILVGEALLADLATFVQEVSKRLKLPADSDKRGKAVLIEDLARQLSISAKTLRRYHKHGLIFHYASFGDDIVRLACYETCLDRFRQSQGDIIEKATTFSRIDNQLKQKVITEAIQMNLEDGLTRQEIARILGKKYNRAVETIRQILKRHEERENKHVFVGKKRSGGRDQRFATRAWNANASIKEIADHIGYDAVTVRRIVNESRVKRIQKLNLSYIELPTFNLEDAESVITSVRGADRELGPVVGICDALELIETFHNDSHSSEDTDEARIAAFHYLKRRLKLKIENCDKFTSDTELDLLERDLRWIALLKRSLVYSAMPTAVIRIEQNLARPLYQQDAATIRSLLLMSIRVVSDAVEHVDPSQGMRLDRVAAFAEEKALATLGPELSKHTSRAAARHAKGSILLNDPFGIAIEKMAWIELPFRFVTRLNKLSQQQIKVTEMFYGLTGLTPKSKNEIATTLDITARATDHLLREAIRALKNTN